jgi:hypothetical protein
MIKLRKAIQTISKKYFLFEFLKTGGDKRKKWLQNIKWCYFKSRLSLIFSNC